MEDTYNLLEVIPPEKFLLVHQKCLINITNTFRGTKSSNIALVFLNSYKIHIELVDAAIELLKSPHLNHITSSMVIRSIFENVANFKHVSEADDGVAAKYLKKSEIFKNLTYKKTLSILEKGNFSNLARFDDSTTEERVRKLSPSAKMTYDMLSSYTHISPFITAQMKASLEKIIIAKKNNLQAIYVAYMSLIFYAHLSNIFFESQNEIINIFKELLDEGEVQGVYG